MRLLLWIPGHSIERWLPFALALKQRIPVRVLCPGYAGVEAFEEHGIDAIGVPTVPFGRITGHAALDYPLPMAVKKQVRRFQPTHVHAIAEPSYFATLSLRRASRGTARSSCRQAQNVLQSWPPPLSWTESRALKKLDHVFALSTDAVDILESKGRKSEVSMLPNGFDADRFPGMDRSEEPDQATRLLFIGKMIPRKGLDLLLTALHDLQELPWNMTVLGKGDDKEKLIALAQELGLDGRVEFKPPVPNTELRSYYQNADLLLLPSQTSQGGDWGIGKHIPLSFLRVAWKEQFGMVIAEAQACGVPCVGSTCGAIPDVIGDAGWVFEEGNLDQLREQLRQLLSNPEEIRAKRDVAMKRSRLYTWDQVADDFIQALLRKTG